MNGDHCEGNWKRFSGKLKDQWSKFLGDNLGVDFGKRDRLAGSVQERQNIWKEEAERQLRDFLLYRNRDWPLSEELIFKLKIKGIL